jgi:hypothetical protein
MLGTRSEEPNAHDNWRAGAAYLYLLSLDGAALAWEYLRRNPQYRAAWGNARAGEGAQRWGLLQFENPTLDARRTHPLWCLARAQPVRLVPAGVATRTALQFDLWKLQGRKALHRETSALAACICACNQYFRFYVDVSLGAGQPFDYLLPSGPGLRQGYETAHRVNAFLLLANRGQRAVGAKPAAIAHLHALQALDGVHAGATHRDIAAALFGAARVLRNWTADGDLRARTRRCIGRARALMEGGYRRLVE